MYLQINKFAGIRTEIDARNLRPLSDNDGIADATVCDNMDITSEGAIITSSGFTEVSSIAGTGGVKNLISYDKDNTDRYLIITHDDDHYSITPSDSTWSSTNLGDYGDVAENVGGVVYKGTTAIRRVILGNDTSANVTKKADITNPMANLAGAPPDGYIMATFMGRLFIANGATLYYSDVEDEDDFAGGGSLGFNDIITGLKVEGQRLIVFTRTYHQGVYFTYDDTFNISTPLKEAYERPYGCLGHKSIQSVGAESYYWSERGVLRLGAEAGYDSDGVPRPMPISTDISPSLNLINKLYRNRADSVYIQKDQQYWLAVPYDEFQYNNLVLVYNEEWKAWTTRSGFYPSSLELFRNSNYEEELYFGDALNPNLYKFDKDVYSYNGNSYTRRWKSKVFTMGSGRTFKTFKRLDLAGAMDSGTEFDVIIGVDGTQKRYRIDSDFILRTSTGEYLGDNYLGDINLGGDIGEPGRFKRFYAPLDFSKEIREGVELQITIENDGEEQPFKIDFIGIDYDMRSMLQVPRKRFVNRQINS